MICREPAASSTMYSTQVFSYLYWNASLFTEKILNYKRY